MCSPVDSGASAHISSVKTRFSNIYENRKVKVKCADGLAQDHGYWGKLKPNSLRLERAVWHPRMPEFLVGVHDFCFADELNEVLFRKYDPYVKSADGKFPVTWNSLPYVDIVFSDSVDAFYTKAEMDSLREHERLGHLFIEGSSHPPCDACNMCKGAKASSAKSRKNKYKPKKPGEQLDLDFWGPAPRLSIRNRKWVLVIIDSLTKVVHIVPLSSRDEVAIVIEKYVNKLRDVHRLDVRRIRCDNAPELRGAGSDFVVITAKLGVEVIYSIPYTPSMNGIVERFMRTLGENLLAMMSGVDMVLWCFGAEYLGQLWNSLPKRSIGNVSPLEKKRLLLDDNRSGAVDLSRFRRFGCLCYILVGNMDGRTKFQAKRERGAFLGLSTCNSGYLCGVWRKGDRCALGRRFATVESRDVKFVEDVLVSSLDLLKEGSVLPTSGGSMLRENHGGPVKRNPVSDGGLSAPEIVRDDLTSSVGDGAVESSDVDAVTKENGKVVESSDIDTSKENVIEGEPSSPDPSNVVENISLGDGQGVEPAGGDTSKNDSTNSNDEWRNLLVEPDAPVQESENDNAQKNNEVFIIRRRGRPAGSKDKRKRKRRCTKATSLQYLIDDEVKAFMADRADDDEEFDHVEVLLTASEVFNSPEAA